MAKKKKAPGMVKCSAGHIVSRRRFNMALKMMQQPTCNECGSAELEMNGMYEVRGTGDGSRLIWKGKKKLG